MRRILGPYAYSGGPRDGCWWDETADLPVSEPLLGDIRADVAVIGGGFTGLSAALHLAEAGASVVVLEAQRIGWGASGRNGGFCCLGGGMLEDAALDARFGKGGRLAFRAAEARAVDTVSDLTKRLKLDIDRHSQGETVLAHRPRDMAEFEAEAGHIRENYCVEPVFMAADALRQAGMGGPFHGAMTIPIGFGLNPRKFLSGLRAAAAKAGVQIAEHSPVTRIGAGVVRTAKGCVRAKDVVIATNGYSSEDLPDWLAARYMPAQSTVLVTRPLTEAELQAQGWTTDQMAYDSRNLLHYFRLMPDRRFLFGMRGGLLSGPRAEARARARVRRDFEAMFPAWAHVPSSHSWSGLVALARDRLPFVGAVPTQPGLWAALCYHGNGIAMGTYAGQLIAAPIHGRADIPTAMAAPLRRFPLGRARRLLMPPLYAALRLADR
ncbi:MAG: FAD-binding oxidoreductase [Pseudomonadota bacterium]